MNVKANIVLHWSRHIRLRTWNCILHYHQTICINYLLLVVPGIRANLPCHVDFSLSSLHNKQKIRVQSHFLRSLCFINIYSMLCDTDFKCIRIIDLFELDLFKLRILTLLNIRHIWYCYLDKATRTCIFINCNYVVLFFLLFCFVLLCFVLFLRRWTELYWYNSVKFVEVTT